MIQRKTQTKEYWQEQFEVTGQDVARLYDLVLDRGRPVPGAELARSLIAANCRREEAFIQAELSRGPAYQPRDSYAIGQQIAFPAFGYAWATVVGTRLARNPAFGEFTAIQVRFDGQTRLREFASELEGEHKLNRTEGLDGLLASGDVASPEELFVQYGSVVEVRAAKALEQHREFVRFGSDWFLRELLADVGIGRLNIAEAMIEVKSMPLPAAELLADLDFPAEVPQEISGLSLKRALEADPRFENVGDGGRDVWYLRRLMPAAVTNPPARLNLRAVPYNRANISQEMLAVEREVDDESTAEVPSGPVRPVFRSTVILTYPHWRSGTLPLSSRTLGLFPHPTAKYTPGVLVDGQTGDRMQGWVVPGGAFVYGLEAWYQRHSLPAGALIKLERTRDPKVVTIDFEPQRLRRVWVKVAIAQPGSLSFEIRKLPVPCQVDEQMLMADDGAQAIDALQTEFRTESLLRLMLRIFPELTKLSPQATVHAKTLYSAINVVRRIAPGPVFALLCTEACFVPMGGGYWTLDETRIRPEAMREGY